MVGLAGNIWDQSSGERYYSNVSGIKGPGGPVLVGQRYSRACTETLAPRKEEYPPRRAGKVELALEKYFTDILTFSFSIYGAAHCT